MVIGGYGQALYCMVFCKALIISRVVFFVVVTILGMSSGLMGRSAEMSAGLVIICKLTMSLGHRHLNSVFAINKYNQLLKPKWDLS